MELINGGTTGIFPYYSRKRVKEPRGELLAVLIIRDTEIYFYIRCQDTYYELNRMNIEEKEDR